MNALTAALFCAALAACQGTRKLADPVLEIRGDEATELGVATDYGLVFLGRSARSGPVELRAWFGDGPSHEQAVVEPLGGGLYTAEPQIQLPRVAISFVEPPTGSKVTVVGRRGRERWEARAEVRRDPKIEGLLLSLPSGVGAREGQVGAGVYVGDERDGGRRLVGLVSGRVELTLADGTVRRYLTVVGPDQLWRLVTYRRDFPRKRKFVYREDVL
jgi:hypothetical protein